MHGHRPASHTVNTTKDEALPSLYRTGSLLPATEAANGELRILDVRWCLEMDPKRSVLDKVFPAALTGGVIDGQALGDAGSSGIHQALEGATALRN